MRTSLGCLASVLLFTASPATSGTGLTAKDDFLFAVQETARPIRAAELLANDSGFIAPLPLYRVIPVTEPEHGVLQRKPDGNFLYVPHPTFFGRDMFQYIIDDGTQKSAPAKAVLEVAPDYIAIRGDFNGDGRRDWGWFASGSARFHACYARPDGANSDCSVLWTAPAMLAGRFPIVGDWNGDNRDEVGLFDAGTGWFHLWSGLTPAPRSFALGRGSGQEKAVTGDWNNDGRDTVGLYAPAEGRFLLRNTNSTGTADYDFVFGGGLVNANVFGVRWRGVGGGDSVGLHVQHMLRLYRPSNGQHEVVSVACQAWPWNLPVEYTVTRSLLVYDIKRNRATNCDWMQHPIDVYIPPPDGGNVVVESDRVKIPR
jgi:hypothetical protein